MKAYPGKKTQEEEINTMRSIKVKLEKSGVTLDGEVLGCAGEKGAVQLEIHVSDIAQEGVDSAFLRYRMPDGVTLEGEAAALPETGPLTVTVPAWAMSERGRVQMQLTLTGADKAVRSYVWSLRVLPSLEVGGTPPEAVRVWLSEVEESIAQALEFCAAVEQVSVTAQTLEAGAPATASGSVSAQEGLKLALGLPTGAAGPKGDTGAKGDPGAVFTPSVSSEGVLSWSNDGGLSNPESVSIRGPKGDKGDPGAQGEIGPQGPAGEPGPTGATFTPAVSGDGTLSWSNDGGLSNPASVNVKGPKGDAGDPGTGFAVLDYFATLAALQAAVTAPSPGDAYGVGSGQPYDIYIYGGTAGWVNNGPLQGAKGATFTPSVAADGTLSWSNDGGFSNPEAVNLKGEKGDAGAKGDTGATGDAGANGVTFTPSVAADGTLSWSNDGGLSNPEAVNLKGEKGDTGDTGPQGPAGTATALSLELAASGWANNALTVSASGVTADCHLIVTPAPSSYDAWCEAGVRATAQGSGTLTFGCTTAPSVALTANVLIVG